ncbi:hypothetical protein MMC07_007951 [Pseudocyphellaria aurata]|nr:hypothetical protein [Pseudocyphellaria aurata]
MLSISGGFLNAFLSSAPSETCAGVSIPMGARPVMSSYLVSGTKLLQTALNRAKERTKCSSWSAQDILAVEWFLTPSVFRQRGERV